jgi:hypothetical protein
MKPRDFLRLPFGRYNLTDGIYDYTLKKGKTESGEPIYFIKEKLFGNSFCLHESLENVFDGSDKYKAVLITISTHVGSVFIHSNKVYYPLSKLKLVPKTNYKNWEAATIIVNTETKIYENT